MRKNDFLLEIGCEELPVATQTQLSAALKTQFAQQLSENNLTFNEIQAFSTPRRLSVIVFGLDATQAPQKIERQGPAYQSAYDKNGTPTLVCLGFAKSCGVSIDQLSVSETPKGKRLVCICEKPGQDTKDLLPTILEKVISKLPLSKPMRWGNKKTLFARPVHWVVALFGDVLVETDILCVKTTRETLGHRFHHPKSIRISKPEDYSMLLYSQGFVIVNQETRKKTILKEIAALLPPNQKAVINEALLDEIVGLVEWPVVLKGAFSKDFLTIPKEALITAMQTHQKCFPVINNNNELLPYFILVSNIKSKNPATVASGNERVIHARLSDAAFFYAQDCKTTLKNRAPKLNDVIFQEKLGSIADKTSRITSLCDFIGKALKIDLKTLKAAAALCKCDLLTDMVREFPALQGIMGYHYALHDGESSEVATAILEQYQPRFSGDALPTTSAGCVLALADRLDTLVGIFGIKQAPTGDKDPFALRRAANGIIRIMIEKEMDLDFIQLLKTTKKGFSPTLQNKAVIEDVLDFVLTRLKSWYVEKGVSPEVFEAVAVCHPTSLLDFDRRIRAVLQFQKLAEAVSLSAANKRVNNILKKQTKKTFKDADQKLFEFEAERNLLKQLKIQEKIVTALYQKADYEQALTSLSSLKTPIDQFFDEVMIMVEDEKKKQNRLSLLAAIHHLLTKVADISLLP